MVLGTHWGPGMSRQKCGETACVAERHPAKPLTAFGVTTTALPKSFPYVRRCKKHT